MSVLAPRSTLTRFVQSGVQESMECWLPDPMQHLHGSLSVYDMRYGGSARKDNGTTALYKRNNADSI
jgi:hypothetical protein